jgi:hypothetical protein
MTVISVITMTVVGAILIICGALLVCLTGCATTQMSAQMAGGYQSISFAQDNREDYIQKTSPSPAIEASLRKGQWLNGMSQDDVRLGLGYEPNHQSTIGGNIVWFWEAGRHRRVFTFSGKDGKLLRTR